MPLCKVDHEYKILYLHGYANNEEFGTMQMETINKVFGEKGQQWRYGPVLDTKIIQGYQPLKAEDIGDEADMQDLKALAKGGTPLFGWWKETKGVPLKEGPLKAATTKLIKHINNIGGVDGVVGFSQGGELACLLAERSAEITKGRGLRFIAAFGCEDVFNKRGMPLKGDKLAPKLCTFFAQGSEDSEAEGSALELQFTQAGIAAAMSTEFIGGHTMPTDEDVYQEMRDFIQPFAYKIGTPDHSRLKWKPGDPEIERPFIPDEDVPKALRQEGVKWIRIEY
jgi:hypothetical protein